MTDEPNYRYHFSRAEREAVRAIQSPPGAVAAIHEELSLRHAGRALAALFDAGADRCAPGGSDPVTPALSRGPASSQLMQRTQKKRYPG